MNNHNTSCFYRAINWCVLIAFVSTSLILPVPRTVHAMNAPIPVTDTALQAIDLNKLIVPENYGAVTERYRARGTPQAARTFIIVQDSHANYEAQSNISRIIDSLLTLTKANIGMICVEGGKGKLQTGGIRASADAAVREIVARYFLKIGYLSGTEYFGITAKATPPPLFGVEDRDLYYKNLDAFRRSYAARPANQQIIAAVKNALSAVQQKICSPALAEVYANDEKYAAGTMPFTDFCRFIVGKAAELKVDLGQFPDVVLAAQAISLEAKITPANVDAEREKLVRQLTQNAVKEEVATLVQKGLLYRTGRILAPEFYAYLLDRAREKGAVPAPVWQQLEAGAWDRVSASPYGNLLLFYAILQLQSRIDHEQLFTETDGLVAAVKKRLFRTPAEEELDRMLKNADIAEKLVNLRMTRRETGYLEAHPEAVDVGRAVAFVRASLPEMSPEMSERLSRITPLDAEASRAFYADALQRDDVLFGHTITQMTAGKYQNAVIVTGGFHKEGIKEKIRAAGYSYAVITPRVTAKYDDTLYLSLMLGRQTEVDRFLERVGTRLAPVLRTSGGMDPAGPVEFEREFEFSAQRCMELLKESVKKSGSKEMTVELPGGYRAVASLDAAGEFTYTVKAVGAAEYGPVIARMLGLKEFPLSDKGLLDDRSGKAIEQLNEADLDRLIARAGDVLKERGDIAPRAAQLIEEIRIYATIVREMRRPDADAVSMVQLVTQLLARGDLEAVTANPDIQNLIPVWCARTLIRNNPGEGPVVGGYLNDSWAAYYRARGDRALAVDPAQAFRYYTRAVRFALRSSSALDMQTVRRLSDLMTDIGRTAQNDLPSLGTKSRLYAQIDAFLQERLFDELEMPLMPPEINQAVAEGIYGPILANYSALSAAAQESGSYDDMRDAGAGLQRFNSALAAAARLEASYRTVTAEEVDRYAGLLKAQYRFLETMLTKAKEQEETARMRSVLDIESIFGEVLILQAQVIALFRQHDARVLAAENFEDLMGMMPNNITDAYRAGIQFSERIRELERVARLSAERERELTQIEEAYEARRGAVPQNDFRALLRLGALEYFFRNDAAAALSRFMSAFELALEHPDVLAGPARADQLLYYLKEASYRSFLAHTAVLEQLRYQEQLLKADLGKTPPREARKRAALAGKIAENTLLQRARLLELDAFRSDLIRINNTALRFRAESLLTNAGILYELLDLQLQTEKNLGVYAADQTALISAFEENVLPKTGPELIQAGFAVENMTKILKGAGSGLADDLAGLLESIYRAKVENERMVDIQLRGDLLTEYDAKVRTRMRADYAGAEEGLREFLAKLDRLDPAGDLAGLFLAQFELDRKNLGLKKPPVTIPAAVRAQAAPDMASWRMKAAASFGGLSVLFDTVMKKIYQFQMRSGGETAAGGAAYDPAAAVRRVGTQGYQVELHVGRDRVKQIKGRAIKLNLDVDGLRPYYPAGTEAGEIMRDFGAILQQGIEEREKAVGRHIYEGLYADRPYTLAIEDATPDGVLFGNHIRDYFIFVNKAVLEKLKDRRADRDAFLQVGFSHELRHEAKRRKLMQPPTGMEIEDVEAALTAEDILLTERLMKKNLPAVVSYLDVLEKMFRPRETGAQYWYGLELRTVLLGGYSGVETTARLKDLLKTVPPNTPLIPGVPSDVFRIVKPFVMSGDGLFGFGSDRIDNKPRLIIWDFNRPGGGIQPLITPFLGKTLPEHLLYAPSLGEKILRARQVAEILRSCARNGTAVSQGGRTVMDFMKGFFLSDKRAPLVYYQYDKGAAVPQEEAERKNLDLFRSVLSAIISDPAEREKANYSQLIAAEDFSQLFSAIDRVSALASAVRERAVEDTRKAKEEAFTADAQLLAGMSLADVAATIRAKKWGLNYRNELAKHLLQLMENDLRADLAGAYLVLIPVLAVGEQNLKRLAREEKFSREEFAALRGKVIDVKVDMGEIEKAPAAVAPAPFVPEQLTLDAGVTPEAPIVEQARGAAAEGVPAVAMPEQSLEITERPQGILGKAMALLKSVTIDYIRMSPIGVSAAAVPERIQLAQAAFSVGSNAEIDAAKTQTEIFQDFGPLAGRFPLVVDQVRNAYERYFSGYVQKSKELENGIAALKAERDQLEDDFKRQAVKEKAYQKRKQELIAGIHGLEKQAESVLQEYITVSDKFANKRLVFQVTRSPQLADFTLHADDDSAVIAINEKMLKIFERIVQMRDRKLPADSEKLARLEKEFEEGLLFALRHEFHHYLTPRDSELKVELADIRYYLDLPADRRQSLMGFFAQPEIKPGDFVNILKRAQDKGEIDQEVYARLQKYMLETISGRIERGMLPQLKAVKPLLEKMKKLELDALLVKLCADIGIDEVVDLYENNPQYLFSLLYLKSNQERGPPAAAGLTDDYDRIEARHGLLVRRYLEDLGEAATQSGDKKLADVLADIRKILVAENPDPRWDIVSVSRLVSCCVDPHIVMPAPVRSLGVTTPAELVRAFQHVPRIGQVLRDIEFENMYTSSQKDVVAKAQGALTELFHALTLQKETGKPVEKLSTPLRTADGKTDYSEVDFMVGDLIVEVKSRRGGKWEEGNSLEAELTKKLWRFAPAIMDPELGRRTKVLFTVNKAVHDRENISKILERLRNEFSQWDIVDIRAVPDADFCVGSGDIMETCIAASRKVYKNDLRAVGQDAKKKYDAILNEGEKRNALINESMRRSQRDYAEMVSRQLSLPQNLVSTLMTALGFDYERIQAARDTYGIETLQGAIKEYISVDRPYWAPDVQRRVFGEILERRRNADRTVAEKGPEIAERIVKDLEAHPVYRMNLVWEAGRTAAQRKNPRTWLVETLSRSGVIVENLPQRLQDIKSTVDAFLARLQSVTGRGIKDIEFIYDKYDNAGVRIRREEGKADLLQLNLHRLLLKEQTFSGSLPVDTILNKVTLLHELYLAAGEPVPWNDLAGPQMEDIRNEVKNLAQSYSYFGRGARVEDIAYLVFVADRIGCGDMVEIQALKTSMRELAQEKIDGLLKKYEAEVADDKKLESLRADIWARMRMYNRQVQDAPDKAQLITRGIVLENDLDVIALLSGAARKLEPGLVRLSELDALQEISTELYRGNLDRVFHYHPRVQRLYAFQKEVAAPGTPRTAAESPSQVAAFPAEIASALKKNHFREKGYETDGRVFDTALEVRADIRRRAPAAVPVVFAEGDRKITLSVAVDPNLDKIARETGVDMPKLLREYFRIFREIFPADWHDRLKGLEGKEVVIGLLDKSQNVFEDHVGNAFVGINRAVFEVYKDRPNKLEVVLGVGIFHELRHEAMNKGAEIEDELAEESVLLSLAALRDRGIRMDVLDFLADLQDLYDIESDYIRIFVNMTSVAYSSLLIGNTKIFNLFIRYGIDRSVFISDCNPPGIGDEAMNDAMTYFGKTIAKIDHHANDPALRRETATSQMIKFLTNNKTAPAMLREYSYITTHVDPDSMLAYAALKNWESLKDRPDIQRLMEEAAYYCDFGLLVKKSIENTQFGRQMLLFANILFGMQQVITAQSHRETGFAEQCGKIMGLAARVLSLTADGAIVSPENPGTMPQPLVQDYKGYLERRYNEIFDVTAGAVRDAVARGALRYDDATGILTVDLGNDTRPIYNPNIMAYLAHLDEAYRAGRYQTDGDGNVTFAIAGIGPVTMKEAILGYVKRTVEPAAVVSVRAPPKTAAARARGVYAVTLFYKENYQTDMPSIAGLFAALNAREPAATKGWGGRDDGGGSNWSAGSALPIEAVTDAVAATIAAYHARPAQYPVYARKIYQEMKAYIDQLPQEQQDIILRNVPMEGDRRMVSEDAATIILDGILALDAGTAAAFADALAAKYGNSARGVFENRRGFIERYAQAKDRLPSLAAGDQKMFYTEYGVKLNGVNPALFEKITSGRTDLSAVEKAQLQSLVTDMDQEAIAEKVFGAELKDLPAGVRQAVTSAEFLASFIALGLAVDSGNAVAFDKRNLFNAEGTGPGADSEVYLKLLEYVAGYCAKEGKKTRLVVFDCKKDGRELANDVIDERLGAVPGLIQLVRTGDDVVAEILARLNIPENELSLVGHQDNLAFYRKWIGKLISMLIFRPDGKLVDVSREELAILRQIDQETADAAEAGTLELVPVVNYDSRSFGQQMKAGLALGIAA